MGENSNNSTANTVAQAIVAALDWSISPQARNSAFSYLESIKAGDVRTLAHTSFILVKRDWSSEIRLQAFKLLQHLVRLRWEELSSLERRDFAKVAVDLISEMANPSEQWALKSQTAALVAEIIRREGINLWQELHPPLVSLSNNGPIQAELVSMILRWVPEDITVHNEDLEGERRRMLLRGLTQSLPEIFPLLYTLLERHFGAALSAAGSQQLDVAKQHAATVTATINAVNAYAEWAPIPDLEKYGLIRGCGFLLSSPDFRLHASEFFKLVCARKKPADATSEFDSAMSSIFRILMNVSSDFLSRSGSNYGGIDKSEFEFAEVICESMVSLGTLNLQCISVDNTMFPHYLQQMLGYFQHCKLALHFQSLLFWLPVLRESVSKPKVVLHGASENMSESLSGLADKEWKGILVVNEDICSAILDITLLRMLKREKVSPGTALSLGALELWSDAFDGKGEFSQYRSRLLDLIKLIASVKPFVAAAKISERIDAVIKSLVTSPSPTQDIAIMESLHLALETVVSAIFDGSTEVVGGNREIHLGICRMFEGLLQQLLSLKWTEPTLAELLARYIEALGPFLKYFPDAVAGVINKFFELLTSLPIVLKEPSVNSARHARLQICTSFVRIALAADKSLLPHMKGIAETMDHLQKEGRLLRGEHNILGEALLVMASAAGIQQQQEALVWLLEPMMKQWTQMEWQSAYLSDSSGLVRLCSSDTQFMWSLFHSVTFFEKALKRSGSRKSSLTLQNGSLQCNNSVSSHPLASHLEWMLPPLLRLLRALHSLWSPPVMQMLPVELKAAMSISDVERASLLGEGNVKVSKGTFTFTEGAQNEVNENDVRNWLKGIRDSGYNVLGLSITLGDSFFKCVESQFVAEALLENIQSMEFRHTRQLIHLVLVPLVKFCPSNLWEVWIEKILHPLLLHCQQALSCSWSTLLREGRANVPDIPRNLSGLDLKVEVMEEKLLRDLTREVSYLLSVVASPGLNHGIPSIEHLGHGNRGEMSTLKDLDAFASSSLTGFLLKHQGPALPALQISIEAFKWTDGESVVKISSFCEALVLLAISSNNSELLQFVSKDLFYAIIEGLALESNAFASADLVGICREIFVFLADRNPSPRQILLSLPSITPQDLHAFEEALSKTSSPKEQKQHMKSLLLLATGNKLKALAAHKSTNVITNVSLRTRNPTSASESSTNEGDFGLSALLQ
ncbi:hypothetical protein MKW98_013070 [Papaver atlanticum]|uniref:Protein HASTY 1 n=1 Tax=Papaver atlanticum TaxID=357466 RepID=A0AAD4T8E9_9MAGN|nr:hypothetical protein MKW98_013070 [Papaver atlanticum]